MCEYLSHKLDPQSYLSTWFCGAEPGSIRQGNVRDLIAYSFWYRDT